MIAIRDLIPTDWEWIQRREPINWVSDICGVTAYDNETGKITGIFVICEISYNSCYCHFVIENPMSLKEEHLQKVFEFVFVRHGLKILKGHVRSSNIRSLSVLKKLGFKKHSWVKDGYSDGDHEIKVILKKEDCKYLRK
jgi:RimJ/RimL family protein N-acetyltransferase